MSLTLGSCIRCLLEPLFHLSHSFLAKLVLYLDFRVTSCLCQLLTTRACWFYEFLHVLTYFLPFARDSSVDCDAFDGPSRIA